MAPARSSTATSFSSKAMFTLASPIQAVLILKLQYPGLQKAWVSLRVADNSSGYWSQYHQVYYDDGLDQQPVGQVDLYLSHFVGGTGLPALYCRPSVAESLAGITRNPMISITYERLRVFFRRARHQHNPAKFTATLEDMETSFLKAVRDRAEAERRRVEAEQRVQELERRLAEGCLKT
ncbi:predicted protein [Chaetomium globosum CBS 148.51]|uniref:Uncharacterized protein n=1 Tax=Chaetomium globosum (strain ATCC 6205 / CBS 148.51 / DSM 1962 / NBRC 6347 / NRRL 1970) TaxID=306901 RepID=Q2GS03_CHAGB|nr:uncharacterized protein CHGG_09251 [Chaetomium globosum CBS 148.51]EAQ85237.1 predicted protein [Chaetomium globosum CBS 148.51]